MENKLTAVVTGANGFVGSHLVDLLLKENFNVRCITRKSSNLRWLSGKDIEIIDCGLFDKEGLRIAFNEADYVYHIAGVVKSKTPEGYFKGNVEATKVLLETAKEIKDTLKRFLIVGSLTAVGPSYNLKPVDENSPCRPITTYGRSKLAQEELAKSFMDVIPITICRAPAVYGERDTEILIFFQTFMKGLMTTIGFNKKVISLIHVEDLVNGLLKASLSDRAINSTYFISSEGFYAWEEIGKITSHALQKKALHIKVPHAVVYLIAAAAQFLASFSNKPATLNIEKARDITQQAWICSPQKAVDELGFKQFVSLEEGIKRTTDWYKKFGWI